MKWVRRLFTKRYYPDYNSFCNIKGVIIGSLKCEACEYNYHNYKSLRFIFNKTYIKCSKLKQALNK